MDKEMIIDDYMKESTDDFLNDIDDTCETVFEDEESAAKIVDGRVEFTKEMKKDYTILIPDMLPVHFKLLRNIFLQNGYKVGLLKNTGRRVVDTGLKYVHNDTCYPALLVIGQMINAILKGDIDPDNTTLAITQTGGLLRHIHMAEPTKRVFPKPGDGQDYGELFRVLKCAGFDGRVSIEAGAAELERDVAEAFSLLDPLRRG